ncbi:MAG TPA: DUF167 domain-containing protein [Rhabdochlamydiaceae bacterium]|jgi:hypothetical protein
MKDTKEGVVIEIKVIPKAAKNALVGWEKEALKVRLHAVPEKGEANRELFAFLAKILRIPQSRIALISGEKHRRKRLLFHGYSKEALQKKIASILEDLPC